MHPTPRVSVILLWSLLAAALLAGVALLPAAHAAPPVAAARGGRCYLPWVAGGRSNPLYITSVQGLGDRESVCIYNAGAQAQLMNGWKLLSVSGNQRFTFLDGYLLAAGASVRIESGPAAQHNPPGQLLWTHEHIWDDWADEAILCNSAGKRIDSYAYGPR